MKIAIVSPEFPPERGGIQTYSYEFARELGCHGHDVTVFTRAHDGGEMKDTPFHIEPVLQLRRRTDRGILRDQSFDVWHAMNAAYSWLALENPRTFVTVHGNDFLLPYFPVERFDFAPRLGFGARLDCWIGDRLTSALVQRALPQAAHIFTNSRYTEKRFCEKNPSCRGKTSAAMVGVSEEYFALPRPPRRAGVTRLVTVCRLAEPHKNVDLVLRALAQLQGEHEFHYTVIGDGHLRPEYERLTAELNLGSRVTFTGFLDRQKLHEHLLDSELFILPTSETPIAYEGFGLVYLEANACGCPVLAARIGGAAEAVEDNVSGILIDTVTAESIAAALLRFLTGAIRFAPEACITFARHFSWARVVGHCVTHYEKSIG